METLEAIHSRRSVRAFTGKPIPEDLLRQDCIPRAQGCLQPSCESHADDTPELVRLEEPGRSVCSALQPHTTAQQHNLVAVQVALPEAAHSGDPSMPQAHMTAYQSGFVLKRDYYP